MHFMAWCSATLRCLLVLWLHYIGAPSSLLLKHRLGLQLQESVSGEFKRFVKQAVEAVRDRKRQEAVEQARQDLRSIPEANFDAISLPDNTSPEMQFGEVRA